MKPFLTFLTLLALAVAPIWAESMAPDETVPATPTPAPAPQKTWEQHVLEHFGAYEPMYFIYGFEDPAVRFQLSFKYRLLRPEAGHSPWNPLEQFYLAYTQNSLWDTQAYSSPFYDTNYRPEAFLQYDDLPGCRGSWGRLTLAAGFYHESNGRAEPESRSTNFAYLRPRFFFGNPERLHGRVDLTLRAPVGDFSDNPDFEEYRGYADLKLALGWADGLELAALLRTGKDFDRLTYQLDLTYPLTELIDDRLDVMLLLQYFDGYGPNLLDYDQKTDSFRLGIAIIR